MPREKNIVTGIVKKLKIIPGGWVLKVHGGLYQRTGIPDILFLLNGKMFAFEVKVPGEEPTPIQRHEMGVLRAAGATAVCVYNWDEVRRCIEK